MTRSVWRMVIAFCAIAVASVCTTAAFAGEHGGQVIFGGQDQTICHATASEDGGNQHNGYNIETVSVDSIVKDNGHGSHTDIGGKSDIIPSFSYTITYKNGPGDEDDETVQATYPGLGSGWCAETTPPTDVCPNLEGVQETVPDGMVKDAQGNCVTPPPPVDVCVNLPGNQATVPDGYFAIGHFCFRLPPPPPTYTVCFNGETLTGLNLIQKVFYLLHGATLGECPPVTDVCPNLEGNQETVPDGYTLVEGECVQVPPPTDVCPNLEGNQETVPAGMVKDTQGNCVTPPPHVVTGTADVYCDLPTQTYIVWGTIDGQAADSVTPGTIPGSYHGWTNVTVHRGDTDFRTAVFTYGDCTKTGPPATLTPPSTPPTSTPPTSKPSAKPAAKPKPKVKPKRKVTTKVKPKPVKKAKVNKKPKKAPKTLGLGTGTL